MHESQQNQNRKWGFSIANLVIWNNIAGVVGLDFKTDAIITKASSTLPLNTALILVNNKGYPIYHDKLEEYAWNDVTTKLQDFQYSTEGKEVS